MRRAFSAGIWRLLPGDSSPPEPPAGVTGRADMEERNMKILVFGAGVTGSLLASRLFQGGADVTILARGRRYEEISHNGIRIVHYLQGKETAVRVPVIRDLTETHEFDLVVTALRKSQVAETLPVLKAAKRCGTVLFLGNDGTAGARSIEALGKDRVLLGFPASGGRREAGTVTAVYRERTPITIGEPDGRITARLRAIRNTFETAGILVELSDNISAWLMHHLALVLPLAGGIYRAGGDNYALSRQPETLRLILAAVREGVAACRALGYPVRPKRLAVTALTPDFMLVKTLKAVLGSEAGKLALRDHAMAAPDEMKTLADEFRTAARRSGKRLTELERLYAWIDRQASSAPVEA